MISLNRRTLTGGSLALLGVLLVAVLVIGNVVLRGAHPMLGLDRLIGVGVGADRRQTTSECNRSAAVFGR